MSVTVITGAGGGMGRACVERFCGEHLLLVDIDDGALEAARALAPEADCAAADLGSRASIETLVRQVEAMGGLDRLVHLAGVSPMMDDAARILEVDLVGTAVLLDGLVTTAGPWFRGDLHRLHRRPSAAGLVGDAGRPRRTHGAGPRRQIGACARLRARSGDGVRAGEARRGPAVPAIRGRLGCAWRPRPLRLPWAHRHAHGTARAEGQPGQAGAHRADADRRTARRRVGRAARADGGHRRRD